MDRIRLAAVAALVAAAASSCTPRPPTAPPREADPLALAPLPEPPALQVQAEVLPGSDGSLAVVAAGPRGPASGAATPSITFSKPVAPLEAATASRTRPPPASISPAVEGEWRWLGSATVEFAPARPLPEGTRFTVTVPAGLVAVDGSRLAEPYAYTFETSRPVLLRTEPRAGWAWVEPTGRFSLVFDRPVSGLERHVTLKAAGADVPLRVTGEFSVAEEERALRPDADRDAWPGSGREDRRTRYELAPALPLPLDAPLVLVVDGELPGTEGPLGIGAAQSLAFRTYGPMALTAAQACDLVDRCSYGPIVIRTTNPADPATLRGRVRIEPPVEIDWARVEASQPSEWDGDWKPHVALPGRFRPGVEYRVTVDAGVRDAHGQVAGPAVFTVRMADLAPAFEMARGAALLEASGDGALPVQVENLTRLEVSAWRLGAADAARLLLRRERGTPGPAPAPPGAARTRRIDLGAERNVTRTRPVPVREILGGPRTALFYATVQAPELDPASQPPVRVIGQITDLAVHAKLGATRGVAWVTRLSDGRPAGGASVVVYGEKGERIFSGTADAEGVCDLPGMGGKDEWSLRSEGKGWMVAATLGDDTGITLSTWSGPFGPWAFGVWADWDGTEPRSLGMVVPERGIYRPGQTVYVKGLARFRRLGAIETPPAGTRMRVRLVSPAGQDVVAKDLVTTAFGTFSTRFDLGKEIPLGTWEVVASGSAGGGPVQYRGTFRVEEYRAPQFRVDVTTPQRSVVAGEPLPASVLARYLFGAPMADAAVAWSATGSTLAWQPPGNEGFAFGNQVGAWEDDEPPHLRYGGARGSGRTDAAGAFGFTAGRAEAPGDRTWEVEIEVEVADVNRQRVAARTNAIVHPASLYAGLRRRGDGFGEAGRPLALDVVAVTPQGAREAADVEVVLRRREWRSIRKKVVGERWMTVTEPVEEVAGTCRVRTAAEPAPCTFTPGKPGFHVAEAIVKDGRGRRQVTRTGVYVVGDGWVSWNRDDTDRVEMVADREVYEVGQVARVLVKSPFADAEALLTVEREGVLERRRVRVGQAASTFEIPVGEGAVPNVFASIVVVRGRQPGVAPTAKDDPGRPAVRIGYVQLKVERKGKRLSVDLAVDGRERRPRETVKVDVQVRDAAGTGVPAEVAIWAVDEGVLRLTGYQLPDLVDAIHPLRGLSVRVAESLVTLVQRKAYGDKGVTSGGGGGLDASGTMRTNFRTTAAFLPEVATDAEGRASVEFELPDNLTTFRIMAIAVTRGDRVGSGQSSVTVARPLLALPALPRLARVGDLFEAGVVVHSPGAKVGRVEVAAEATGVALEGEARRAVELAAGKPREVRFRFRAERPGEAVLRFTVAGGGERDGLEERIPVVLPVAREAVALHGETRGVAREAIVPPGGVRPDAGGLDLTLSSSAIAGLQEGMRQLVDYPYGCLEQLSSRLVPFVALREIQGRFGGSMTPPDGRQDDGWMREWLGESGSGPSRDPDEVVRRTVKAIEALQGPEGGYRYWPGSGCPDPLASAWAVLALGQAARLGYPVDAAGLARGQGYLADTVASGRCIACGFGCVPPPPATRAFAVWALARTGSPRASFHSGLYAQRESLPLFARAMLADAMFLAGNDRRTARELLDGLLGEAKVSGNEVHFEDGGGPGAAARWSSDVRTTAIVLGTLVAVAPDHPFVPRMATWLLAARGRDGRYRNTQEAAFALLAMADLVRVKERETPDFTGTVVLGGKTLAEAPFHGRSLSIASLPVPISALGAAGDRAPLEFRRDGPAGTLHYGALLRYVPERMPVDPLDRGILVQRWFEPWEGGGQVRGARAGDLLRVRVRVATPRARRDVAIDVPIPAGLEIVDATLASGSASGRETASGGFWSPFDHRERRDDRMVLFSEVLPAGLHEATFVVRATTPGTFVSRPAQAEEMYAPEVFGRSDGGTFRVVDPEAGGAR